jgi:flagellar motor protein MotB
MQINSTLDIEIAGHVNHPNRPPVVKESWEYKLSEARAKLVYDYLLENGIPAERVSWKGYGNWEMRYPHATSETDMALNRRVEIRVR